MSRFGLMLLREGGLGIFAGASLHGALKLPIAFRFVLGIDATLDMALLGRFTGYFRLHLHDRLLGLERKQRMSAKKVLRKRSTAERIPTSGWQCVATTSPTATIQLQCSRTSHRRDGIEHLGLARCLRRLGGEPNVMMWTGKLLRRVRKAAPSGLLRAERRNSILARGRRAGSRGLFGRRHPNRCPTADESVRLSGSVR